MSTFTHLEREGQFKLRPLSWRVKTFPGKQTVAIAIEFRVLAQQDADGAWIDWGEHDYRVWGDFFVIQSDGKPNVKKAQSLATLLGWDGNFRSIAAASPPDVAVQGRVISENYQGKTFFKVDWIDPEDHVRGAGGGLDESEASKLDARFGSLLRAATAAAKKTDMPPPPKRPRLAPSASDNPLTDGEPPPF